MKLSITTKAIVIIALQCLQTFGVSSADAVQLDSATYSEHIQVIAANSPTALPIAPEEGKTPEPEVLLTKPAVVSLDLPFFAQAPQGDWSAPFQEACEEMSVLLVQAYLQSITWNTESISQEVRTFTKWVKDHGYQESVSIEELAVIAKQYAQLDSTIITDPSIEQLEALLDAGFPVIVPLAGQMLGNPYFVNEGPEYHMLVVSGYNQTHFITKEVGTQFGDNYQYSKSVFMDSIHNYTGDPSTILQGTKKVLVLHAA